MHNMIALWQTQPDIRAKRNDVIITYFLVVKVYSRWLREYSKLNKSDLISYSCFLLLHFLLNKNKYYLAVSKNNQGDHDAILQKLSLLILENEIIASIALVENRPGHHDALQQKLSLLILEIEIVTSIVLMENITV